MDIDIESLERATLDAVAPAEVGALPDWLLPFDTSSVGRATSAVPLRHHLMDPSAIPDIEALYAERGLKTQFRIAQAPGLAGVQERLLKHGYCPQQPTLTLVGTVLRWPTQIAGMAVQLSETPTQAWKSVYLSGDFDPVDGANRVRALSGSKCLVYASLSNESGVIAAGTAAFSQGWVSLHGLRTIEQERGKGCASAMIAAFRQLALSKATHRCFLQVEAENAPAISLYRSLGFQTAWLYHYWREAP
jgi:ribosomal protein S18 acetylase RimI-like enzyme